MDADVYALLGRLVALSPEGDAGLNALVRRTCAETVRLPPLPYEGEPADSPPVAEFAEQFAADVAALTPELRSAATTALGARTFGVVALTFIADYVPRVKAGLEALGLPPIAEPVQWDRAGEPVDLLLNVFVPMVGARRALDPLLTELVRLRGAVQHNCRLCRSLREGAALDAGGGESLYDDIERYESSTLLDARQKAALRYVDALIWTPAAINVEVVTGVRAHFDDDEALELTLDIMRNATNKIAVALGADAPRVEAGTETYFLGVDGQPVYS